MSMPEIKHVNANTIPEVRAFMRNQKEYEAWKEKYPAAHQALAKIEKTYNAALKAGDLAVREQLVSSGPFELYSFVPSLNAEALCAALGRPDFIRFGGTIETTEAFAMETARFDGLVVRGTVTPELASAVISYGPRFHKPSPISLPK